MKTKFKLCALIFALICMAILLTPNQVFAVNVSNEAELKKALETDGEQSIVLTSDFSIQETTTIDTNRNPKPGMIIQSQVTIDGNGHTITAQGIRTAIEIYAGTDVLNVTLKNITIKNTKSAGRCIDTRTGNINLLLEDVILETTSAQNNQPLTIGGKYTEPITVKLDGTTISAGVAGYGITTFNPVNLSIENDSEITGYGALYLQGQVNIYGPTNASGTAGSKINVSNSILNGFNKHSGASNNFATIKFEDDGIELNIENSQIGEPRTGEAYQHLIREKLYGDKISDSTNKNKLTISNSTISITDGIRVDSDPAITNITIKEGVTSTIPVEGYLAENVIYKVENDSYITYKQHGISVNKVQNGTVEVDKILATSGETVTITAKANEGYQLKTLKAYTNNEAKAEVKVVDGKFVMPNVGVVVIAEFEKIEVDYIVPENKAETNNQTSIGIVQTEKVKETLDTSLKADKELNKKVEEAIKNGENVSVEIKMEALKNETVKEEEKQKILQTVKENQTVHQYFDISVLVTANQKELGKLTELTDKMKFSVEISKDLIKEGRKFYIIKLHGDEVKRIEAVLNGTSLEFETDEFSTFALAYEDGVTVAEEKDDTPKTGSINVFTYVWMSLVVVAVVGIVTTKKPSKHSK